MKTYQIVKANGCAKESWEEINCDSISINGDVITFFELVEDPSYFAVGGMKPLVNNPLIVYKLADGEALIFVSEEKE